MNQKSFEFKLIRQVEFAETDLAGIMHYSNFFRFMEAAEHAFFRSLGFSIHEVDQYENIGWPRVHATCNFSHPLRFEDLVEIHLKVKEKKEKTLAYSFKFYLVNEDLKNEVAEGELVVACVSRNKSNGSMTSIPIPERIFREINVAP
jgi:YbgC/YbaW family acyl-CoA thioester hydrolase